MLHLFCGRSGSGKTQRLTEAIRRDIEAKTHCILLVPEQQVYTSEREFPKQLPKNAGRYFEIISFTGLSEKLFRRFGGLQFLSADQSVRSLMMWNVLRNLKGLLSRYGVENTSDGSLTKLMCYAVEDLRINGISPEELDLAAESLPKEDPLQKKLHDLSLIYASYYAKMDSLFEGKIPEERLLRLAGLLSEKAVFSDTHIYVDSFTSFTHDENKVLLELMKQAKEVTIALCVDRLPSSQSHFYSISETGKLLKKMANDNGIPFDETFLERPDDGTDLSYLEQNLWKFDAPAYSGKASHVKLLSARNVYEECEAAAENIRKLVQNGIRYGEISVVVRDFETYHGWLEASLEKRSIPYFLSERNEFSKQPLARLVLSALRSVLFSYRVQDVLSLLKTGLSGVSFRDASLFEEYIETWHITGKQFLEPEWKRNPDGLSDTEPNERTREILDTANRVRKQLIEPLEELTTKLPIKMQSSFSDACEALYGYLLKIDLPNTLYTRAKAELERGAVREAQESARLFAFLTELLGKAKDVLGEEKLTAEEFLSAVNLLFASSDLGSVPQFNDCVILGSASTLRVENVKATLVLGLCEGEFPGDVSDGGILSESEKQRLYEEYNIEFRSSAELKQSEELFYVYRTFTKPTEALILSAPLSVGSDARLAPSIAFTRVKKLFGIKDPESFVLPEFNAREFLPQEEDKRIPSSHASLSLSSSSLEDFANCPYSYHLTRTLGLRKTADAAQGAIESGNFLHHVFAEFLKEKSKDREAFSAFVANKQRDDATFDAIAREYVRRVCNCEPEELDPQLLHQFARMAEVAVATLYGLHNDGILSDFQNGFFPTEFEVGFQKSFPVEGSDQTVTLKGQIDRIDQKEDADGQHFRVVDYKSSKHKFEPDEIKTGKEIQLVLYLMVLLDQHNEWASAQGKYLWGEPSDSGFSLKESDIPKFEPNAKEAFSWYEKDLNGAIKENALRIFRGDAQKTPSKDACRYCALKKYCPQADRSKEF